MLFPLNKDGEEKNVGIFELYNRQQRQKKHRLTKYSSETNVTREKSRHIDLKDSKLAISFIGANEFLHPQNFGLMSPFVSTSTSNSGETSENSDSFTDSSLICNNKCVATESLDNLEIVSAATKIAKFEKKYFLANLLPIVVLPWIATFVIIAYARVITKFSHEVNIERLNAINMKFAKVQRIIRKVNKSLYEIENPWDGENKPMNITLSEFGFNEIVTYKNLPHALNIFIKLNSEIMEDIDQISLLPMNGSIAFTVYSIVFFILMSYGVWKIDIKCSVGFDSLFHFPIGFVEEMNKPPDLGPPLRLAGNVLELNINIYTGFINYVSSNSPQIIGLEPIDIIGRKYDEVFVKDNNENRIFTYPQTRKTKKFIECRYNKKHVTYIALYDRNNDSQSFENLLKSMVYYVPSKISKNFVDGGVSHYQMKKCFIILVHFDNEFCNSQTDHVFSHLFNCLQCFSTVNILRVEGSCIYFIVDGNEASVPLLFIRDVIFGFKVSNKSQKNDLEKMFLSIVITKSDFVADINYSCEPYVHVNYSHCNLCHSLCFSSPLHSVVFLGNCIDLSPFDISKKTTKLSGNSTAVPFSLFNDIVNCLY
ncbi:hypothetical protein TVAG_042250 [Trichomonas vaginalis G3]|uniref:PAS domain-containing protein n=1 Tax=Trichomonas vaginalis (strain ATCC PRA-98 / G3) TaxID=412133 RepID=A2EUW4_TRIV3|nr:hypothetical protein TVAGG3_0192470 [Trichomonas vaginalis G3]EAY03573.1 hypothetical protein TVAG_042250 [Trichomonas vaginalis G3]KAI5550079.1 hypothetical protein TVAGG3_0192470 [Trichomonas vaginalis G3]|eukprot:XP_001315796.1 hypothetical protein [Trichomonas vaginalis G3]